MEQLDIIDHHPLLYSLIIILLTIFILKIKKKKNKKKRLQLAKEKIEKQRRAQESISNLSKDDSSIDYYDLFGNLHLPKDIIPNILLNLSPKSLLQLRRLNKSWYKFLKTQEFTYFHLQNQPHSQKQFYIAKICRSPRGELGVSYLTSFQYDDLEYQTVKLTPFGEYTAFGCCNGLLCLQSVEDRDLIDPYVLLNPFTKEFKPIRSPGSDNSYILRFPAANGFGFVQEAYDYKILTVETFLGEECDLHVNPFLYTLSSDSWKELRMDMQYTILHDGNLPQFRGILHFLGKKHGTIDEEPYYAIITFHLKDETFGLLSLPRGFSRVNSKLYVWRDQLTVVNFKYTSGFNSTMVFNLWVMREYGNGESWMLGAVTQPLTGSCSSVGVGKNGELLLLGNGTYFFLYDFDIEGIKRLGWSSPHSKESQAFCYENSLVTFDGRFPVPKASQDTREREETLCFIITYGLLFVFLGVVYFILLVRGYFYRYIVMLFTALTKS